jgi:peptidoglycan/xylan/chitin deacetylase (PgdA/CDA1 family)
VIRHVFAMHVPAFGRSLKLPLTLADLRRPGFVTAGAVRVMPAQASAAPPASGPAAAGHVALTFDDGPHPEGTPQVLEVLAQYQAKATFFLVGEQVSRRPELARRILAEGHTVALHGYLHRPHPTRRAPVLADDFARGIAAIADATGVQPLLHRPPYGIYSAASLWIARERGLQPLLWSRWGKDWRKVNLPEQIAARVLGQLRADDVILLHDADFYSARRSHRRTVAALPLILEAISSAALTTVGFA